MKNNYSIKIFLLALFTSCSSTISWAFDGTGTIVSGGVNRTFLFHSPGAGVANNLPVVIILHGDGGSGSDIKSYSGFDASADANNFLAVYPDAINANGGWNRGVDAVPGDVCVANNNPSDDVLFISDLIDYLCNTYGINPNKIYATGHSAGGYMTYRLAIELANKIAAFAPVSASLCGDNTFLTNYFTTAYIPVPIYHIHGDADAVVGYPDPDHAAVAWDEWPLSAFSYPNCNTDTYSSTTNIVPGVNRLSFCVAAKEVYLIQIAGGGHGWPAVPGYNAADAIWNFCNAYALTTTVTCVSGLNEINNSLQFSIFQNKEEGTFTIRSIEEPSNVTLFDILGNEVLLTKKSGNIFSYSGINAGIYIVKLSAINNREGKQKLIVQ